MLKNQSNLVLEPPSDEIYKFINIWVGNGGAVTPDKIENAVVNLKVAKSWIQDKNIDKSTITLNRYNDTKWNALPTKLSGEDNNYLYFTAQTPVYTTFAITGKSLTNENVTDALSEIQSKNFMSLKNNISNEGKVAQEKIKGLSKFDSFFIGFVVTLFLLFIVSRHKK
jgi:hypothetical protein